MRAYAVLAVILCHAQLSWFAGGYIGVDVFFVISGYVVARSIVSSARRQRFSPWTFYSQRLRRLVPAMLLVLLSTLTFIVLFCFPEDAYAALKNSALVLLSYSNIYLSKQTGYFDLGADRQPLLHTWSLSVEEQFYLLCPWLLLWLSKRSLKVALTAVALLFALSLAWSVHAAQAIPQAYFKMQYRAFEFLLGVALALLPLAALAARRRLLGEAAVLTGGVVIGACVFAYDASTPMPGWHALLPCVGAGLIIVGGHGHGRVAWSLRNPLAVYLGRLSYALYLWHWPVLFALRRLQIADPGVWSLPLTLALSVATYHLVELPIRWRPWSNRRSFALLLLLPVLCCAGLMYAASKTDNFEAWYSAPRRAMYYATSHSVFDAPRARTCWSKVDVTAADDCSLGVRQGPVNAVLWGDSHAYHQIRFIDAIGRAYGLRVHDLTMTMCPPNASGPKVAGDAGLQSYRPACLEHSAKVMRYIMTNPDIRTVFMAAVWQSYQNPAQGAQVPPSDHGYYPGDTYLADTVAQLNAAGKRVVFLDDVPVAPPALENCWADQLYLPWTSRVDCSYPRAYAMNQHRQAEQVLRTVMQRYPGNHVLHTFDVACDDQRCHTQIDGVPLYRNHDTGHLGLGGSVAFYRAYRNKHSDELARVFGAGAAPAL